MLSADVNAGQQQPLDAGKEGAECPVPGSAVDMEISLSRDEAHLTLPHDDSTPTTSSSPPRTNNSSTAAATDSWAPCSTTNKIFGASRHSVRRCADSSGCGSRTSSGRSPDGEGSDEDAVKHKEMLLECEGTKETQGAQASAPAAAAQDRGTYSPPQASYPWYSPEKDRNRGTSARKCSLGSACDTSKSAESGENMGDISGNPKTGCGGEREGSSPEACKQRYKERHENRHAMPFAQPCPYRGDDESFRTHAAAGGPRAGMHGRGVMMGRGEAAGIGDRRVESRRMRGHYDDRREGAEDEEGQGNGRVAQIAEGLMWVHKHPVLAAVIWMCGKVLNSGSEEDSDRGDREKSTSVSTGQADTHIRSREGGVSPREEMWGGGVGAPGKEFVVEMESDEANLADRRNWWKSKVNSKGRLSWSDEYGGSLAEYYEDERGILVSDASCEAPDQSTAGGGNTNNPSACGPRNSMGENGIVGSGGEEKKCPSSCNCSSSSTQNGHQQGNPGGPCRKLGEFCAQTGECCRESGERFRGCAGLPGNENEERSVVRNVALRALSHSKGSGSRVLEPARRSGASTGPDGGGGNEERAEGEGVFQRHKEVFYEHLSGSGEDYGASDGRQASTGVGPAAAHDDSPSGAGDHVADGSAQHGSEVYGNMLPRTSTSSAGTWSPQWGWYVSMTPPQDLYPAQKSPGSSSKLGGAAANNEPVDGQGILKGRPPRP